MECPGLSSLDLRELLNYSSWLGKLLWKEWDIVEKNTDQLLPRTYFNTWICTSANKYLVMKKNDATLLITDITSESKQD